MRGWGCSLIWHAQGVSPTEAVRLAVDEATLAFWADPAWAAWMEANSPPEGRRWFRLYIEDREDTRYRITKRDDTVQVTGYAPAEPFRPRDPAASAARCSGRYGRRRRVNSSSHG